MADNDSSSNFALVRRLYRDYIRAHIRKIGLAALCMVFAAAATAANAWLMQPVLDEIFLKRDGTMLFVIPLAVFFAALIKAGATYGQHVTIKIIGQRVVTDMQLALFRHLLHADILTYTAQSSGHLVSRFSNDIQVVRRHLGNVLAALMRESVTLVFLVGLMFYQSWELALIAFAAFPLAVWPTLRLGKRMRKVAEATQRELADYTARLDDTFQGIRMVKAYGREDDEASRASAVMEGIFNLYTKAARIESAAPPIMELLAGIAIASVIGYGGWQVLQGVTTPGAFFSFIAALIMAYKPMKGLSGLNANMQEALAAARRFYAAMDAAPAIRDMPKAKPVAGKSWDILFENVSFRYTEEKPALKNLSLKVPEGNTVALVGPSGAGKSTLMHLLLRFYDPDKGAIYIGGQDIRRVTLASLRNAIAVVSQEATLFDTTIRANIAYGKPGASEEAMLKASYAAAAHDFIAALPEGYDTMVGQHGVRLSGGQRQRIAIARAMLKDAPILLLDEATSALDSASENQVRQAVEKLMEGRTTLVIAHRLSTVMNADIISVIKDGAVVETGTHKKLLAKDGEYSALYKQQCDSAAA